MSKKVKPKKKPVTVKLSVEVLSNINKEAKKLDRKPHYLLCQAINEKYK